MRVFLVSLIGFVFIAGGDAMGGEWVTLFNGKDLEGWTEKTKSGNFRVEDGAIIGTAKEGLGSTFLCTNEEYGDFELEFETKLIDAELNSGVQIRSQTREAKGDQKWGPVNGPQVEVSAGRGENSYSGNIYGQGMGQWITPKDGRKQHDFMKAGEWNQFRVVAKGNEITTWINGSEVITTIVPADLMATHGRGFIGLQLHGIKEGTGPFEAAWRNIRIKKED
ncbi:MAG: DUF1080 domain-containing protein [Verrucomicrobiota bacterium]